MRAISLAVMIMALGLLATLSGGCQTGPYASDFNRLGLEHFNAGDYDNAEAAFAQAADMAPTMADYHYNLAAAQQARGRLHEAILSYRSAVRLDPGLFAAHENMALCYLANDDTASAEQVYQRMCELNPMSSRPFIMVADYWLERGDKHRGREYLSKAVGADPQNAEARRRLYLLLEQQGERELAAAHYRVYLELLATTPGQVEGDFSSTARSTPPRIQRQGQ